MEDRQPIAEGLISCRNILLGEKVNEHVLPCLQNILVNLASIEVVSTRKIIRYCVANVIDQIKGGNFLSAGRILNLVHNLPLNELSEQQWNIDYFLSIQLSAFLDDFEEIKSARLISLYVCKQLACSYMDDGNA